MVNNYLTFDIEEWYHANYDGVVQPKSWKRDPRLVLQINQLLSLCQQYEVKATFFVVGELAEHYPQIIKKIAMMGHEVASHGYAHKLVYQMTQSEFERDLLKSMTILKRVTGASIVGFRAPSWSVNNAVFPWYYRSLAKLGITYSSSVFPGKTPLYGIADANPLPHLVKRHGVWEIPSSVMRLAGVTFGFAGGFYLRVWPLPLVKAITQRFNLQVRPVIFYLHPREIDPEATRLKLPLGQQAIHYWGVRGIQRKLRQLMSTYGATMRESLSDTYANA